MIHITCRLTAKNWDQLWNPTFGNRVWAALLSSSMVSVNGDNNDYKANGQRRRQTGWLSGCDDKTSHACTSHVTPTSGLTSYYYPNKESQFLLLLPQEPVNMPETVPDQFNYFRLGDHLLNRNFSILSLNSWTVTCSISRFSCSLHFAVNHAA